MNLSNPNHRALGLMYILAACLIAWGLTTVFGPACGSIACGLTLIVPTVLLAVRELHQCLSVPSANTAPSAKPTTPAEPAAFVHAGSNI